MLPTLAAAQVPQETELARNVLTWLQPLSFAQQREYCGYLALNRAGTLIVTPPVAGNRAGCAAAFPSDLAVVASYHTHGTFDEGYHNEVPSTVDIESDSMFYINGYVATPGGRFWYIDGRARTARQICGLGCLPAAPMFRKGAGGAVAEVYTYDMLRRLHR